MTVTRPRFKAGPAWSQPPKPRLCLMCGGKLKPLSAASRKTCSDKCRQRLHRRRKAEDSGDEFRD